MGRTVSPEHPSTTSLEPPEAIAPSIATRRRAAIRWFLYPWMQLAIGALLVTASELLLRRGAQSFSAAAGLQRWLGIAALRSAWTWAGIVCYILSFASWVHVLRFVPLSVAFPVINIVHVLIPIGAWLLLGERILLQRWVGILLVLIGILLLVHPFVEAEERL